MGVVNPNTVCLPRVVPKVDGHNLTSLVILGLLLNECVGSSTIKRVVWDKYQLFNVSLNPTIETLVVLPWASGM